MQLLGKLSELHKRLPDANVPVRRAYTVPCQDHANIPIGRAPSRVSLPQKAWQTSACCTKQFRSHSEPFPAFSPLDDKFSTTARHRVGSRECVAYFQTPKTLWTTAYSGLGTQTEASRERTRPLMESDQDRLQDSPAGGTLGPCTNLCRARWTSNRKRHGLSSRS